MASKKESIKITIEDEESVMDVFVALGTVLKSFLVFVKEVIFFDEAAHFNRKINEDDQIECCATAGENIAVATDEKLQMVHREHHGQHA